MLPLKAILAIPTGRRSGSHHPQPYVQNFTIPGAHLSVISNTLLGDMGGISTGGGRVRDAQFSIAMTLTVAIRPFRTLTGTGPLSRITCALAIYQRENDHSMMAVGFLPKPGRTSFPETKCSGTSGRCSVGMNSRCADLSYRRMFAVACARFREKCRTPLN
jgi:hypothetical protein